MYVHSVRFENLRGFKDLDFTFERPNGEYAGWTVFVGGNASGKSTLLKGIALALMGPDAGNQLLGPAAGWIHDNERRAESKLEVIWDTNHDKFKGGGASPRPQFEAAVRWLIEGKDSTVPVFRSVEKRTSVGTRILTAGRGLWNPNAKGWFAAGYGPMRRLSGSSSESIRFSVGGGIVSRFVTLFREDAALSESEVWLKTNHARNLEQSRSDLKTLLDSVSSLLGSNLLPHSMKISKITVDHVLVKDARGMELPMRDISDGCRSVYATILDLVHGMFEVYGIENLFRQEDDGTIIVDRPGIVLIDEIEAHLHPAWQKDIPEWLKKHFPKVQFLVATHSPLVAQAADPNGVFVLPSQFDLGRIPRPLSSSEYEKIRLGRAEKTLLGSAFGLKSVRSRWANQAIERWKKLNAKDEAGVSLSKEEKTDLKKLKKQMEFVFAPVSEMETP